MAPARERILLIIDIRCCPATAKPREFCYVRRERRPASPTARIMFWLSRITSGRVLGLDRGDWSLLVSGVVLAGLLVAVLG
jgi:hypothetical protein